MVIDFVFIGISFVILITGLVLCFLCLKVIKNLVLLHQSLLDKVASSPFLDAEVTSFLNLLQDAIESGEETLEYSELEINEGKFRILQGRLKALAKRLDPKLKGYILSCLVQMGLTNNPFILDEIDFSNSHCQDEDFQEADLSRIVAREIDWSGSILSGIRLENAKLSFAKLNGARLDDARLTSAYLNEAEMQGCYLKGADLQRAYLIETNLKQSYLAEANLEGALMRKADLSLTNLSSARLFATNLSEANFQRAIIKDAVLQGAILSEADLSGAYLTNADLEGSDLWRANLSKSIIIGTNFQKAYFKEAQFSGVYKDLLECEEKELEKLQEKSEIGLYSSNPVKKYDVKATNFKQSSWWLADFDKEAAKTLWSFLIQHFAPPNAMEMTDDDWHEFALAQEKIKKLLE